MALMQGFGNMIARQAPRFFPQMRQQAGIGAGAAMSAQGMGARSVAPASPQSEQSPLAQQQQQMTAQQAQQQQALRAMMAAQQGGMGAGAAMGAQGPIQASPKAMAQMQAFNGANAMTPDQMAQMQQMQAVQRSMQGGMGAGAAMGAGGLAGKSVAPSPQGTSVMPTQEQLEQTWAKYKPITPEQERANWASENRMRSQYDQGAMGLNLVDRLQSLGLGGFGGGGMGWGQTGGQNRPTADYSWGGLGNFQPPQFNPMNGYAGRSPNFVSMPRQMNRTGSGGAGNSILSLLLSGLRGWQR